MMKQALNFLTTLCYYWIMFFYLTLLYVFENLILANISVILLLCLICHIFSLFGLDHCHNCFHLFLTCNWVLCFKKKITKWNPWSIMTCKCHIKYFFIIFIWCFTDSWYSFDTLWYVGYFIVQLCYVLHMCNILDCLSCIFSFWDYWGHVYVFIFFLFDKHEIVNLVWWQTQLKDTHQTGKCKYHRNQVIEWFFNTRSMSNVVWTIIKKIVYCWTYLMCLSIFKLWSNLYFILVCTWKIWHFIDQSIRFSGLGIKPIV
jgi:hypothetical protein